MYLQKIIRTTAVATVLVAGFSSLGAAPAQAWTYGEPTMTLTSSLTVDGPEGDGYGVTYSITVSDTHHLEGKSFFKVACSPELGQATIVSKLPGWSTGLCEPGYTYQVNDLSITEPGGSQTLVAHFTVTDLSKPVSITVKPEDLYTPGTTASTDFAPMTITSSGLPKAQIGASYAFQVGVSRFTPTTFSATGLEAAGLRINAALGVISGTPTVRGTFPVRVVAHSSSGGPDAVSDFLLRVVAPAPTIAGQSSAVATGVAYSSTITATREPAAQFQVTAGRLPAGLALNKTTGVISGTPTKAGDYHFSVTVVNEGGSASAAFGLEVRSTEKPDEM